MEALISKSWFKQSADVPQRQLLELASSENNDWHGCLQDLALRPEEIGGIRVVKLDRIAHGSYMAIFVFEVEKDGEYYSYEYVGWKHGEVCGAKAFVFLSKLNDTTPSHFVLLRGERFATGKLEYDLPGGFLKPEETSSLEDTVRREVTEELGAGDIHWLQHPLSLGNQAADPGMTNSRPAVFHCHIQSDELFEHTLGAGTPREVNQQIEVFPISELSALTKAVDSSVFHSAIARMWALDLLPHSRG